MSIKKLPSLTFNAGEYVVYPTHGVGKVADVTKQNIAGSELELLVVNFDKDKMTLRIPTSKIQHVGLRKISDDKTMNEAFATLKGKAKVRKIMWPRRPSPPDRLPRHRPGSAPSPLRRRGGRSPASSAWGSAPAGDGAWVCNRHGADRPGW